MRDCRRKELGKKMKMCRKERREKGREISEFHGLAVERRTRGREVQRCLVIAWLKSKRNTLPLNYYCYYLRFFKNQI